MQVKCKTTNLLTRPLLKPHLGAEVLADPLQPTLVLILSLAQKEGEDLPPLSVGEDVHTYPWPTPGPHWTKGIKLLPSAVNGTRYLTLSMLNSEEGVNWEKLQRFQNQVLRISSETYPNITPFWTMNLKSPHIPRWYQQADCQTLQSYNPNDILQTPPT